jgi:hypothetical protein
MGNCTERTREENTDVHRGSVAKLGVGNRDGMSMSKKPGDRNGRTFVVVGVDRCKSSVGSDSFVGPCAGAVKMEGFRSLLFFLQLEGDEKTTPPHEQLMKLAVQFINKDNAEVNDFGVALQFHAGGVTTSMKWLAGGSADAKNGDHTLGVDARWESGQLAFGKVAKQMANQIQEDGYAKKYRDIANVGKGLVVATAEAECGIQKQWEESKATLCHIELTESAFSEISSANVAKQDQLHTKFKPEVAYAAQLKALHAQISTSQVVLMSGSTPGMSLSPGALKLLADEEFDSKGIKGFVLTEHSGLLREEEHGRIFLDLLRKFDDLEVLTIHACDLEVPALNIIAPLFQRLRHLCLDGNTSLFVSKVGRGILCRIATTLPNSSSVIIENCGNPFEHDLLMQRRIWETRKKVGLAELDIRFGQPCEVVDAYAAQIGQKSLVESEFGRWILMHIAAGDLPADGDYSPDPRHVSQTLDEYGNFRSVWS